MWVLLVAAVLGLVTAASVLVGVAVVARHRAAGAADLAALAAAGRAVTGDPSACTAAADVARANGAELTACRVGPGAIVEVEVAIAVRLGGVGVSTAVGRARAGPVAP